MRLLPGQRWGKDLTVLEELGSGSFGHVYAVRHEASADPLALKLSKAPLTAVDAAKRALREVSIQRAVLSPHVPKIFDCGLDKHGYFFALMEKAPGAPLHVFWPLGRRMPPPRAIGIARQVCEALASVHALGVVHRDVKPSNIFVSPNDDHVHLLDFGLARSWEKGEIHGITATRGNMLIGTPHYAQPEQLDGIPLSPAADVYSLGVIVYELLSGYTPFDAERDYAQVTEAWRDSPSRWMSAHAGTDPIPLRHHLPSVSRELSELIASCLAKNPRKRPASAAALGAQLGEILAAFAPLGSNASK